MPVHLSRSVVPATDVVIATPGPPAATKAGRGASERMALSRFCSPSMEALTRGRKREKEEAGAKLLIRNNHDDLIVHCESGPVISSVYHNPLPGKLVIFSSDLEHSAQQHNTDDLRITLAYNYAVKNDVETLKRESE